MSTIDDAVDRTASWYPVATEYDVLPRSLFRGQLNGRELVLWRADDGFVNVWENRCLHRGVRLSIGVNDGAELICRYHGWRYANRSAGCTYIPAHPANSPARTITNRTYPVVERYGLVWTAEEPVGELPSIPGLTGPTTTLRSLPVDVPAAAVLGALVDHRFLPVDAIGVSELDRIETVVEPSEHSVTITAAVDGHATTVVFFVQPVTEVRSVIRGVVAGASSNTMAVLRHHAAELASFVRRLEADHEQPVPDPAASLLEVPVMLPEPGAPSGRGMPLEVRVVGKEEIAESVMAFDLAPVGDAVLPTAAPGAHIDVHLPDDLVRQYSLTNAPGDAGVYRIAVKRTTASRGGSRHLHRTVEVGDVLHISEPRNAFPLRRNVPHTIFIAGGIGVTPLVSMASALDASGLDFVFHQFAAGPGSVAFRDRLEAFGDRFATHLGLTPAQTHERLIDLLDEPGPTRQVYCCGPPPMLDAIRGIAAEAGWRADAVHFEYFENATALNVDSSFTLELARSAMTLEVSAGSTILQTLREHDVPVASSCETGACGTCQATVLGGTPLHQDVYLNAREQAAGHLMMPCVSRALGDRLVLDL